MTGGGRGWYVGVDTGGTFTDLVARRGRETRIAKVPSTPPAFQDGVVASIVEAGLPFADIDVLCHGTTVATNALITRTGAATALLTTAGFRDVLELRRHNRGELYDLAWDFPEPLVPRRHRYEVRERVAYDGSVVAGLALEDVDEAVRRATRQGIASFAVAFLHSYVNPAHEFAARDRILELVPDASVYTSSELLREPGEFERTSTVVVNAYMGALVGRYVDSLASRLGELGFDGHLFVMHSGGGLLTAATASRMPARLLTSGPAAGAMAAATIGRRIDPVEPGRGTDVISLDIGGTSADIAVILDGRPALGQEFQLEFGIPIRFPAIDLTTIGAGGGSLARVDAGGLAHVGPESAGAVPGPAAYDRGGTAPTLTDANVVLGRLPASVDLAGGVGLNAEAAARAVDRFAEEVGLPRLEAAAGIVRIANANMARAIRVVTVQRGLDPRRFTLVAFGGAGGLHAADVAHELQIPRVVMPRMPGVTSALGCLAVAIEHDVADAYIVSLATADLDDVRRRVEGLEARVAELLAADGVEAGDRHFETMVDLRFVGQLRSLTLPVPDRQRASAPDLEAAFRREYERQFHYAGENLDVEISALRVRGRGPLPDDADVEEQPTTATAQADIDTIVEVHEPGGPASARVVSRHVLRAGELLQGPAIVVEYDSTTWVPTGWTGTVTASGDLVMAVQAADLDPEETRHVVA